MIVSILLDFFFNFLNLFVYLLPDVPELPSGLDSAISNLASIISPLNSVFPLANLFVILSIILIFEATIFAFKTFNWIYNKIRGAG